MDHLVAADEEHERMMAEGSKLLRTAMEFERRGVSVNLPGTRSFRWKDFARPSIWDRDELGATALEMARHVALIEERDAFAFSRRVRRDPCTRCGVRADVGCKHRRVA